MLVDAMLRLELYRTTRGSTGFPPRRATPGIVGKSKSRSGCDLVRPKCTIRPAAKTETETHHDVEAQHVEKPGADAPAVVGEELGALVRVAGVEEQHGPRGARGLADPADEAGQPGEAAVALQVARLHVAAHAGQLGHLLEPTRRKRAKRLQCTPRLSSRRVASVSPLGRGRKLPTRSREAAAERRDRDRCAVAKHCNDRS